MQSITNNLKSDLECILTSYGIVDITIRKKFFCVFRNRESFDLFVQDTLGFDPLTEVQFRTAIAKAIGTNKVNKDLNNGLKSKKDPANKQLGQVVSNPETPKKPIQQSKLAEPKPLKTNSNLNQATTKKESTFSAPNNNQPSNKNTSTASKELTKSSLPSKFSVCVKKIPLSCSSSELLLLFSDCSPVEASVMPRTEPYPTTMGFIHFRTLKDAQLALKKVVSINGSILKLTVQEKEYGGKPEKVLSTNMPKIISSSIYSNGNTKRTISPIEPKAASTTNNHNSKPTIKPVKSKFPISLPRILTYVTCQPGLQPFLPHTLSLQFDDKSEYRYELSSVFGNLSSGPLDIPVYQFLSSALKKCSWQIGKKTIRGVSLYPITMHGSNLLIPYNPFKLYDAIHEKVYVSHNADGSLRPTQKLDELAFALPCYPGATRFQFFGDFVIFYVPYAKVFGGQERYQKIAVYRKEAVNSGEYVYKQVPISGGTDKNASYYEKANFHFTFASISKDYLVVSRLPYHEGELEREEEKRKIYSQVSSIAAEKDKEILELLRKVQLEKENNLNLNQQLNIQKEKQRRELEERRREAQILKERKIEAERKAAELQRKLELQRISQERAAERVRKDLDPVDFFVLQSSKNYGDRFVHVLVSDAPAEFVQIHENDLFISHTKDNSTDTHRFEIKITPEQLKNFPMDSFPLQPEKICDFF